MTVAFVLSGGGNYGSLQVGALQVLLERGIQPDLLVGASAGAMNATSFAMDPTLDGLHRLAEHWRRASHDTVSSRGNLAMIWRLVTRRDGLMPNAPLRRYLERTLPPGVVCFGHLRLPAYALAVRLDTGEVRCFGDDPSDRLIDGLMATTAIPGFYPPWECDGVRYVDGATEIYALNVSPASTRTDGLRGTLAISLRAIDLLIQGQGAREIQVYESLYGVTVHHIRLSSERPIAFWDFRHADRLMAAGRRRTEAYLDGGGVVTKDD